MKRTCVALLSVLAATAGCTTYYGTHTVGANDYVLATRSGANGSKETFELRSNGSSLRVSSDYERERPFLGFQVTELDKRHAERRGVRPYTGLLVTGVYPQSSAAAAGVMTGDVLLSFGRSGGDKREMVYLPQLAEYEATLQKEQVVTATVLRGQTELDLSLVTNLLKERVTDAQDVELERVPQRERPYAGVVLRGIPGVWCERIFGRARNAVVVSEVEVGSPAWLAGVRGGDVIDAVDGAPVPTAQELSQRIADAGPAGGTMKWSLRRGSGEAHEATVELADYGGEANVWVPLVFRLSNGTWNDRWTVGPFGLLLSNRNHYIADQATRRPQTRNVFSALLGLFRVETTPQETEVRLLWLIRFDT